MNDLSPEGKALFEKARASFDPTESRKARVHAAVLASTTSLTVAAAAAKFGGAAALAGAKWVKIVGISILVVGAGATVAVFSKPQRARSPLVAAAPSVTVTITAPLPATDLPSTPELAPAPDDEAIAPSMPRATPLAVARTHPSHELASDTLAEEIRAMHDARQALQEGKAEQSLALAGEYESRYPHGVLREEELAIRVLSLCLLGRVAEATTVANRLEKLAPRSPQLARVKLSCVSQPATNH